MKITDLQKLFDSIPLRSVKLSCHRGMWSAKLTRVNGASHRSIGTNLVEALASAIESI